MDRVPPLIFQKIFNKVHYQKLLKNLIYHGIEEKTLMWLNKDKKRQELMVHPQTRERSPAESQRISSCGSDVQRMCDL